MNIYQPLWDVLKNAPNFPLKDFEAPETTGGEETWRAACNVWSAIRKEGEVAMLERTMGDYQYHLTTDAKVSCLSQCGQEFALIGFMAIYCGADRKTVGEADYEVYKAQVAK